jgi:hypothetical protein
MKTIRGVLFYLILLFSAMMPAMGQEATGDESVDWGSHLWDAIEEDRLDLLAAYLQAGRPHTYPSGSYDGEISILHIAFRLGKVEAAAMMLDAGVQFDLGFEINRDYDWIPIIESGSAAMVKLALARGYDPNLRMAWRANGEDSSGFYYPLSLAAKKGNGEIISLLLDAGADPNASYLSRFNPPVHGSTFYSFNYRSAYDLLEGQPALQELVRKKGGQPASKNARLGESATVSGAGLRVRSSPGTDGEVLGKLNAGLKVRALRTGPEDTIEGATHLWVYVAVPGGLEGWVFSQFLSY